MHFNNVFQSKISLSFLILSMKQIEALPIALLNVITLNLNASTIMIPDFCNVMATLSEFPLINNKFLWC